MKVKVIMATNNNYNGKVSFCLGVVKAEDKKLIKEIINKSNADHIWTEEKDLKI